MLTHTQLQVARELLASPTTFGTTAAAICLTALDQDSLDWDPVILEQALIETFGKNIAPEVLQRVQAVAVILNTGEFFQRPGVFHAVCTVLLDPDGDPHAMLEPPLPVEMAWACTEAKLLLGDFWTPDLFLPDVARYCGVALEYQGYAFAPKALSFADFTGRLYPDERHANEQELMHWTDDQEQQIQAVDVAVEHLVEMLGKQILQLREFGDAEAFAKFEKAIGGTP